MCQHGRIGWHTAFNGTHVSITERGTGVGFFHPERGDFIMAVVVLVGPRAFIVVISAIIPCQGLHICAARFLDIILRCTRGSRALTM